MSQPGRSRRRLGRAGSGHRWPPPSWSQDASGGCWQPRRGTTTHSRRHGDVACRLHRAGRDGDREHRRPERARRLPRPDRDRLRRRAAAYRAKPARRGTAAARQPGPSTPDARGDRPARPGRGPGRDPSCRRGSHRGDRRGARKSRAGSSPRRSHGVASRPPSARSPDGRRSRSNSTSGPRPGCRSRSRRQATTSWPRRSLSPSGTPRRPTSASRLEDRDGVLRVAIRDDGVGGADPIRGSGLTGLRDRVEALGGRLEITSAPGAGTLLVAEIPTR
jgi:hypothetical protein